MYNQMSMFQSQPTLPSPQAKPSVIYEPKGRAREYAQLACNIYAGCDHQCVYCYAPDATRKERHQFNHSTTRPNLLRKLEKDCQIYQANSTSARVLLSFTCDPYQHLDVTYQTTRSAIETLHRYGLVVEVLTKGGTRALRDLDLFTDQDAFATTLTTMTDEESQRWEPHAAPPPDRIEAIRQFHAAGIPTWVSLEPVLYADTSLQIIHDTHDFVDVFKVGTLNYHPHARTVDWPLFARNAVDLLTSLGYHRNPNPDTLQNGDFYVKRDLACHLKG